MAPIQDLHKHVGQLDKFIFEIKTGLKKQDAELKELTAKAKDSKDLLSEIGKCNAEMHKANDALDAIEAVTKAAGVAKTDYDQMKSPDLGPLNGAISKLEGAGSFIKTLGTVVKGLSKVVKTLQAALAEPPRSRHASQATAFRQRASCPPEKRMMLQVPTAPFGFFIFAPCESAESIVFKSTCQSIAAGTAMADELSLGTFDTDAPALEAPGWDTPFRFAILGDFTGRANRGLTESSDDIARREGKKIDRENFDEVLAELAPQLSLNLKGVKGGPIELSFASLDDFHADEIVAKVERFEDLSAAKDRVALLAAILHHPDFKALEAVWAGSIGSCEKAWTGENGVEVVLYDLAESELSECVRRKDDLSQSPLYTWLVEKERIQRAAVGRDSLGFIGLPRTPRTHRSSAASRRLPAMPRPRSWRVWVPRCGTRRASRAKDDLAAWEALRQEPAAAMLGLAGPGFLLRQPYGVATKPVEKIAYEEYKTGERRRPLRPR